MRKPRSGWGDGSGDGNSSSRLSEEGAEDKGSKGKD